MQSAKNKHHGALYVGQLGHGFARAEDLRLWSHESGSGHTGGSYGITAQGAAEGERRHRDDAAQSQSPGWAAPHADAVQQSEDTRSELQCDHAAAGCHLSAAAGHTDREEQSVDQFVAAQIVAGQAYGHWHWHWHWRWRRCRQLHAEGAQSERKSIVALPRTGHRAATAQVSLSGRQQDLEHIQGYLEDAKVN